MDYQQLHTKTYDAVADEYESNAAAVKPYIADFMKSFFDLLPAGASVLEVGCGTGQRLELAAENNVALLVGVEQSPKMVDYAKKRNPKAKIILGNFLKVKLDDKFDGIIMGAFIHLFPQELVDDILNKAHSLLKPNGKLYIDTGNSGSFSEGFEAKIDYAKPEVRYRVRWTKDKLTPVLKRHGFEVIEYAEKKGFRDKAWMIFVLQKAS